MVTGTMPKGKKFLYADRKSKSVIKCTVVDRVPEYPIRYIVVDDETNKMFSIYDDAGCYELTETEEALKDAMTPGDRIVY